VGGIPELVIDQTTGVLVSPQKPSALAAALSQLMREPLRAKALGQAGRARAQERFDVSTMAQANERLYYELLGYD
jgi:starch synthase